jgi:carbonic anhydrase
MINYLWGMKWFLLLTIFSLSSCTDDHQWSYYGASSPDEWGKLSSDYKSCDSGHHQSPINLSRSESKEMNESIVFNYHDSLTKIVNNGHTIKAEFREENNIEINKDTYYLKQLHFHTHSEHSVDGMYYPLKCI